MSLSRFLGGNLCVALWWLTSWLLVCFNSLAAPIPVIDAYKRPPNIIIFNVLPVIERTIVRCMKIAHSTGSWGLNATPKTFRSLRNGLGESMRQPCDVFNCLINRDSRLAKEIKENDKILKQQVIPNEDTPDRGESWVRVWELNVDRSLRDFLAVLKHCTWLQVTSA